MKNYILYTSCLRRRPMDSHDVRGGRDVGHIDHEVPNLSVENIGASIPLGASMLIFVSFDETYGGRWSGECRGSEQRWRAIWVPNELCFVVLAMWSAEYMDLCSVQACSTSMIECDTT